MVDIYLFSISILGRNELIVNIDKHLAHWVTTYTAVFGQRGWDTAGDTWHVALWLCGQCSVNNR